MSQLALPESPPPPALDPGRRSSAASPARAFAPGGGRGFLSSIRDRLLLGGVGLVVLIAVGAVFSFITVSRLGGEMHERLTALRQSSEIGSSLESLILNQITAGERYLLSPAPEVEAEFTRFGLQAHDQRRKYKDLRNLTPAEQQEIVGVEGLHARIEAEYALAHAQQDVGDRDGALRRVTAVRPETTELERSIRKISAA
ncbi:MAG TPA: hypothetical protein VFQ39_08100, partial [Longimicrobium sp.]|nr:hypothetical protein [Longimicrobium sp.]